MVWYEPFILRASSNQTFRHFNKKSETNLRTQQRQRLFMQQEAKLKPMQLADLASFPTAGSKEPRFHKPHIASSVKNKTDFLFFCLPPLDMIFNSTSWILKKNKSQEDKFSNKTNQKEVQSSLHSRKHLSGWRQMFCSFHCFFQSCVFTLMKSWKM